MLGIVQNRQSTPLESTGFLSALLFALWLVRPGLDELLAPDRGKSRLVLPRQAVWKSESLGFSVDAATTAGWPQGGHLPVWVQFSLLKKEYTEVRGLSGPSEVQSLCFWNLPRRGKERARRLSCWIAWVVGFCPWTGPTKGAFANEAACFSIHDPTHTGDYSSWV